MKSTARSFVDKILQHGGGLDRLGIGGGKTEFVLLPQLLEILQTVNEQKRLRRLGRPLFASPVLQLLRQAAHCFRKVTGFHPDNLVRDGADDALQKFALREIGRRAVEHEKPHGPFRVLRGQRHKRDGQNCQRRFLALTDNQKVAAALPPESRFGRSLDRVRRAQPDARLSRRLDGFHLKLFAQQGVFPHIRRRVAFEHKRPSIAARALVGALADFCEETVAHIFRQPHGLERTVALDGT